MRCHPKRPFDPVKSTSQTFDQWRHDLPDKPCAWKCVWQCTVSCLVRYRDHGKCLHRHPDLPMLPSAAQFYNGVCWYRWYWLPPVHQTIQPGRFSEAVLLCGKHLVRLHMCNALNFSWAPSRLLHGSSMPNTRWRMNSWSSHLLAKTCRNTPDKRNASEPGRKTYWSDFAAVRVRRIRKQRSYNCCSSLSRSRCVLHRYWVSFCRVEQWIASAYGCACHWTSLSSHRNPKCLQHRLLWLSDKYAW